MLGLTEVGPMDALKLGDLPLAGPGEGVGLGGAREDIARQETSYECEKVSNNEELNDVESARWVSVGGRVRTSGN